MHLMHAKYLFTLEGSLITKDIMSTRDFVALFCIKIILKLLVMHNGVVGPYMYNELFDTPKHK